MLNYSRKVIFSIFALALLGSATLAYAGSLDFILSFAGDEFGGGVAFNLLSGIATDSNNRIIVADSNIPSDDVQVYDSTGSLVLTIDGSDGDGVSFITPTGVAVNSTGHIFVSDLSLDKVQIYDSTGTFVSFFNGLNGSGTEFISAIEIAIDSNDRIIVGDSGIIQMLVLSCVLGHLNHRMVCLQHLKNLHRFVLNQLHQNQLQVICY